MSVRAVDSAAAEEPHPTRFDTVEVNGTFYSLVTPQVAEAWRACVPPGFLFSVKASRYVTHMKKLGGGVAPLANFFAQGILRLGAMLGPILWQLPPSLPFSRDRARAFLELLPHDLRGAERLARRHDDRVTGRGALRAPDGRDARLRHALEVRHESWLQEDALKLLQDHDVALVAADTAGKHPASVARTASFAYVRLHGSRVLYGEPLYRRRARHMGQPDNRVGSAGSARLLLRQRQSRLRAGRRGAPAGARRRQRGCGMGAPREA